MSILDRLNDRQREAGACVDGAVLILAGAGSGKTRTITYRIAHMIEEKGISPYNILAVTFTNKAAKEMKERVEDLIGEDAKKTMISTFHSFGLRLLRVYGDRLDYNPNFTIYDTDDQKRVIKNIMKDLVVDSKSVKEGTAASIISNLKENGISANEYEESNRYTENGKIIAEIYRRYDSNLKKNNAMDFSDILVNTSRLLDIPEVLEKVQEKFKYIMVDEYQDTNNIQYIIINKIARKYGNICVVGDENQSIYGFRGANIQNILDFEKDYPSAKVIKLEENYRSTSVILEAANEVIKNNTTSKNKKLWTKKVEGDKITVQSCEDGRDEAGFVALEILKGKKAGRKYRDFTILYRTNAQSRMFEEKFLRDNIPYKIFGGMQFYQRAEIKDLIAYLSIINNNQDNLNLARILNVPKRKIGDKSEEKLLEFATTQDITLFDTLKRANEVAGLSANLKLVLLDLGNTLEEFIEYSQENTVSDLLEKIIKDIGYNEYLEKNYEDFEGRKENIAELLNSIKELENMMGSLTLREYLENVSLVSATDDLKEENDYVKLMTIHNSKGLEFPIVFVVGAEEGTFPGMRADFDSNELEEERRLCYVAITRAEEKLYITHAKSRAMYGQESKMKIKSRFIEEIPKHLIEAPKDMISQIKTLTQEPKKIEGFKNIISIDDLSKKAVDCPYNIGEKLFHKKFGLGIVREITDKKIVLDFVDGRREIAMAVADKFLTKQ